MKTTILYRPVNKKELDLIQATGWSAFPPRLPDQPIFYPVTNQSYASQITTEWNVPSYKNGFVTKFELSTQYLSKFRVEQVGLDHHTELWVPANELREFNDEIIGKIKIVESYHENPSNSYVLIKDIFSAHNYTIVAFEFLDKKTNFEITDHSFLGNIKLDKYLHIPRKLNQDGSPDLDTFVVRFRKDTYDHNFMCDSVELLISHK